MAHIFIVWSFLRIRGNCRELLLEPPVQSIAFLTVRRVKSRPLLTAFRPHRNNAFTRQITLIALDYSAARSMAGVKGTYTVDVCGAGDASFGDHCGKLTAEGFGDHEGREPEKDGALGGSANRPWMSQPTLSIYSAVAPKCGMDLNANLASKRNIVDRARKKCAKASRDPRVWDKAGARSALWEVLGASGGLRLHTGSELVSKESKSPLDGRLWGGNEGLGAYAPAWLWDMTEGMKEQELKKDGEEESRGHASESRRDYHLIDHAAKAERIKIQV
ncbi:hypothetical protein DFH09DRAFT_1115212 [Mycena vulgaris]|nr:hypothetical protein DFH09DRAFT_1115212 [Mycena vulgaris]